MGGSDRGQSQKAKNQEMAKHLLARGFWHGKRPNSPFPNSGGTPNLTASGSAKAQRRQKGLYSSASVGATSHTTYPLPAPQGAAQGLLELGLPVDFTGEVSEPEYNIVTRWVNGVPVDAYRRHQTWGKEES